MCTVFLHKNVLERVIDCCYFVIIFSGSGRMAKLSPCQAPAHRRKSNSLSILPISVQGEDESGMGR